jgi:Asp/Glu/hydantoin racemase
LREGPAGIETQEHVESVTLPLRRRIEAANGVDAFVIACYSDPGLHVAREGTSEPVFGIAECGVLTALTRADRFGVIAIKSPLDPAPYPLSPADGADGQARRRAAARNVGRGDASGTARSNG